ncbi:MAG: hypothetical protein IJB35_02115 [Oscillospiraceae bacterium]|nr:hypothetical protein [Oscillospiraceae bacterium]
MEIYKKAYFLLFNVITDALEQMDQQNLGNAQALLMKGQQDAEALFLAAREKDLQSMRP